MTQGATSISPSLIATTTRGAVWTSAGTLLTMGMQLVYTTWVSRVVEPKAFGLVAGAMIGMRFITYFSRFGISSAVIQRQILDDVDIRVAHTLSVALGIASAAAGTVLAPVLAALLRQPEAVDVMRWTSIGLFVAGVGAVPEAVLRRSLRFRALAMIGAVSFAVGYLGVGIALAARGWGVWSLVAASIAQGAVLAALCLLLARAPLRPSLDMTRLRRIMSFGGKVSLTGFLEFVGGSVDTMSVGRWAGSAALGQYSRAAYLVGLPTEQLTTSATRVLFPALSHVQADEERFGRGVLSCMGVLSCIVTVPVAVGAAAAPALVALVLGAGWDTAASVMPIAAVACGFAMLTHVPALAVEAKGAVGRKLRVQAMSVVVTIGLVGAVVATGPTLHRLAGAWLVGEILRHLAYWLVLFDVIGVSARSVANRYLGSLSLALAASAPFLLVVRAAGRAGVIDLAGGGVCAATALVAVWHAPWCRSLHEDVARIRAGSSSRVRAKVASAG